MLKWLILQSLGSFGERTSAIWRLNLLFVYCMFAGGNHQYDHGDLFFSSLSLYTAYNLRDSDTLNYNYNRRSIKNGDKFGTTENTDNVAILITTDID